MTRDAHGHPPSLRRFWGKPSARALLALLLVILVGCVFNADGAFFKLGTHRDALRQSSVFGILACGMTLVIISGGIDLAVGSVLALVAPGVLGPALCAAHHVAVQHHHHALAQHRRVKVAQARVRGVAGALRVEALQQLCGGARGAARAGGSRAAAAACLAGVVGGRPRRRCAGCCLGRRRRRRRCYFWPTARAAPGMPSLMQVLTFRDLELPAMRDALPVAMAAPMTISTTPITPAHHGTAGTQSGSFGTSRTKFRMNSC